MKITPDQYPEFKFQECEIAGDKCWLITPGHINTEWTEENAWMRSAIIRQDDGFCVSQGFKKFTNWGEKPAFQPWVDKGPIEARHKLDGSCLIVSRYKGVTICRTRGSVDAEVSMANGHEIAFFRKKYPKFFSLVESAYESNFSYLFEWTSPENVIILREHKEPTLTLIGQIHNHAKWYVGQSALDQFALEDEYDRPTKYSYNSVAECIADVKAWVGKEGVVIYSEGGQTLKKIKGEAYLALHRLKGSLRLGNINHVIECFLASPRFDTYEAFFAYVEGMLDYEVASSISEMISQTVKIYNTICEEVMGVIKTIELMKANTDAFPDRKAMAVGICKTYPDYRRSFAFSVLDGKASLDDKFYLQAFESHLTKA